MATEVIMPALGMAQETGRLIAWLKQEGDTVKAGDIIMEVETDKTTVEIEASAAGILSNLTAQPGDDVPVGEVIALILAEGESAPKSVNKKEEPVAAPAAAQATPETTLASDGNAKRATPVAIRVAEAHGINIAQVPAEGRQITRADVEAYINGIQNGNGKVLASPKARRLAKEHGYDLKAIIGSGPDGAVIAADVLDYKPPVVQPAQAVAPAPAPAKQPAAKTGTTSTMWRRMAERLTESWQTVPHFYLKREISAVSMMAWREGLKQRSDVKITYTDLMVKLVAMALRQHPHVNGGWDNETGLIVNEEINIGLAVAVEDGLLVPVIHHADKLGIVDIAVRRQEIVERAQNKKLKPEDLQGGTFSLSNLGMFGIDQFDAIVNPPQAAILATGRIADRIVPENGQAVIRPMMTLTLSCDHRAVDGARGAQFLDTLAKFAQDPLAIMD